MNTSRLKNPLHRRLAVGLLLLTLGTALRAAELPTDMVGTWTFVPERSTDLSPWRSSVLEISLAGTELTIDRLVKGGRRSHRNTYVVDLAAPSTPGAMGWWTDNRHLGAYAPHEGIHTISPTVLDDGRVLRLSIDYTLETQQGERQVNTLRQFQISPDGDVLTVIDLRTTRPRPVIHVYERSSE